MPIVIADYDPKWPDMFETEALHLRDALEGLALGIEHVGSTSVPGLAAKPVIDIQVSVANLEPTDAYRIPLEALGYTYATLPFPFFHKPAGWPHTHHVHVREAGSHDARRTVAFRDWLRSHPADREAYEALKRNLASNADSNSVEGRFRYSEAKTEFVRSIESRARTEG
jgi:GrpB-like predicted nucleotidyltransferase (UPF0157 family)